ncbi:MAG: hypothetical protein M1829_004005 [Trizodia sp. TS-e1964]|nr:MAG: hypothetical protein M1829_004005 [Trizodia sp. TS-e1964]
MSVAEAQLPSELPHAIAPELVNSSAPLLQALPSADFSPTSQAIAKPKLFGRAFYESIGSPKIVLAPMVDQSEFAWRLLSRQFLKEPNTLLAYTPMLHARLFANTLKYREGNFQATREPLSEPIESPEAFTIDEKSLRLDGNPKFDRPLIVQFCANTPDALLQAAKYVQPFCDAVDLNLGCPQGIARKGNYGAFLQEDWKLIYSLINILHKNLAIPVTAKIRILENKERTLEYAKMVLSAGASILTVHGRQREQKGHNTGLADWSVIRYLRVNLPPETVIFANGNILQNADIQRCLDATGADAVMSAEGNLFDPSIFAPPPPEGEFEREYWRGDGGKGGWRADALMRRYLDIIYEHALEQPAPKRSELFHPTLPSADPKSGNDDDSAASFDLLPPSKRHKPSQKARTTRPTCPNLCGMQAHLFHLLRPLITRHTHIRDKLARCHAGNMRAFEEVLSMVEDVTRDALLAYGRGEREGEEGNDEGKEEGEDDEMVSSRRAARRVRRPWWVCQSVVRPVPAEAVAKGAMRAKKKRDGDGEGRRGDSVYLLG